MWEHDEICFDFVFELDSPKEMFDMVMEYADTSGKGEWDCFGYVFSQHHVTVVMRLKEDGYCVGYISGEFLPQDKLFVHHGYVRSPIKNCDKVLKEITDKINEQYGKIIKEVVINSDKLPRLWARWGFKESNEKIYTRRL
jgi:hypothetical protein